MQVLCARLHACVRVHVCVHVRACVPASVCACVCGGGAGGACAFCVHVSCVRYYREKSLGLACCVALRGRT